MLSSFAAASEHREGLAKTRVGSFDQFIILGKFIGKRSRLERYELPMPGESEKAGTAPQEGYAPARRKVPAGDER